MSDKNFRRVTSNGTAELNKTIYLKPADLADAALEGTFEGPIEGNYGTNYRFSTENGESVIVNGCGVLNSKMPNVPVGSFVKLDYLGKKEIREGKMKGKSFHDIDVLIAE